MALEQIKCLNPDLPLNLAGYDYRAFVQDGVFVSFNSSPDTEPESIEEEVPEGDKGTDLEVGSSSKVVSPSGTAPPNQ